MTWQVFIFIYLILSTASELLRRRLGESIPQYNKLVNAFFFIGIHYPVGLIAAQFLGYELNIGWFNIATLVVAGIAFPISGMMAFRASKNVDAGLFSIVANLNPVVTIVLATLLLSERLSGVQLLAALILIFSALLVTIPSYSKSSKSTRYGIIIAIATTTLIGIETVYEVWMLDRIGIGTYLIYGWGFQTFWMGVFAWPERKKLKRVFNKKNRMPVIGLSLARSFKGFSYIAALSLSGSASLVGAFSSFLPVLVVVAGVLLLKERKLLKLKLVGAVLGSIGLLILSTS